MFWFARLLWSVIVLVTAPAMAHAESGMVDDGPSWQGIRGEMFGERPISDGAAVMHLDAPERAEDAAIVPISIRLSDGFASGVKKLSIVIDENPSPIAATFTYGKAAGEGERMMATRIRVDRYTFVRAIAETEDGKLYMTRAFIKASGGCSAPASRDIEEAQKSLGKMRIKTAVSGKPALAEVAIRHPNVSGLAIDQLSGGYPPARFISKLTVSDEDKLVFSVEGGISISEDPHFRFTYGGNEEDVINVSAEDSIGTHFSGRSASSF
jgi:sulfur-oxidizing protein SoxY